jgi:hypothetical protein
MSDSDTLRKLSYLDRCDRCGAQAKAIVLLHSGNELAFCQHHLNKYEPALVEQAVSYTQEWDDAAPPF